LIATHF